MLPSDELILIRKDESRDITEVFTGLHFVSGSAILGKRIREIFITDFYRHPVAVIFLDGSYTTLYPDDAGEFLSIIICNELIKEGLKAGYIGGQALSPFLMREHGYDIHGKRLVSFNFYKSENDPCIFLQQVARCSLGLEDRRLTISYIYDCGYIVDANLEDCEGAN